MALCSMYAMEDAFRIFDVDGSGSIDPRKLGRVMKALGQNPTEAEVQDLITAVDDDGNGMIEFNEFKHMMEIKLRDQTNVAGELKEVFRVFDKNGKGSITADDMKVVFSRLGQEFSRADIEEMIQASTGRAGEKQVTFEEFAKVFKDEKF